MPTSSPPTASWFHALMGFEEDIGPGGYERTQSQLELLGPVLRSRVSGRRFHVGQLELAALGDLRARALAGPSVPGASCVRFVQGDAGQLHARPEYAGALFQVASQFNLLEMPSPAVAPESGVSGYAHDRTQGPACAIACGAATVYRSYLVPVDGQPGQRAHRQLDALAPLAAVLSSRLGLASVCRMRNGYGMFAADTLAAVSRHLSSLDDRQALRDQLTIGVQWDTEVAATGHRVSQALCSALPIGYHSGPGYSPALWEPLALLILEALYEATLWAAVLNAQAGRSNSVLLTLVGGGVFANELVWIRAAIDRALRRTARYGLDVVIVFYRPPTRQEQDWVRGLGA